MITLYTLFPVNPTELQYQWLKECIESIKQTSFNHVILSCDGESGHHELRKQIYTSNSFCGCLDYDDKLIPEQAEELYKYIVDNKSSGTQLFFSQQQEYYQNEDKLKLRNLQHITPIQVTQQQLAVHHLTILNTSLIPQHLFNLIDSLDLKKNIDWICKAYVALKFKVVFFNKPAYIWRIHDNNTSKKWEEIHKKIYLSTSSLLKCIAPANGDLIRPYPKVFES